MSKIIKNTLLNYVPVNFEIENNINPARVYEVNYPLYLRKRIARKK